MQLHVPLTGDYLFFHFLYLTLISPLVSGLKLSGEHGEGLPVERLGSSPMNTRFDLWQKCCSTFENDKESFHNSK